MKPWIVKLLLASLLATLGALSAGSAAFAAPSQPHLPAGDCFCGYYVHLATADNTYSDWTELDDYATVSSFHDPSAFVFVMSDVTPHYLNGDPSFVPADLHPLGVFFDTATSNWIILNEDGAAMPVGAAFEVLWYTVTPDYGHPFLQQATSANTTGSSTFISNPLIDGQPNLTLEVTANFGASWVADTHPLGVWYNSATGHWAILHEDGTPIPLGATYNVIGYSCNWCLHTATATNIGTNITFLDPSTEADDIWHVTPVQPTMCKGRSPWMICFPTGPFDTSPLAEGFFSGVPTIINMDGATMSTGTTFFAAGPALSR